MLGKLRFLQALFLSKKTSKKIVVIESDDWGSERIPNKEVRQKLSKLGVDMETNPHAIYDTLERVDDLSALGKILDDIQKEYQKKVVITTNFIMSNPDFEKIRSYNFCSYYKESILDTYLKRDGDNRVIDKINELIRKGYFRPQFHGREHINAQLWLDELKTENSTFLGAFNLKCYAIDSQSSKSHRKNLMAALEYESESQKDFILEGLKEGYRSFETIFGYKSSTFIAPRYVWNENIEATLIELGISHLQTAMFQKYPSSTGYKNIFHYTGQHSKTSSLKYLVRNNYFEPAYGTINWVKNSLKKVALAFRFQTPAIICMHRVNFVGGLNEYARDNNLKQLKCLLESIIKKYPNVKFISSDELSKII